MGVAPEPSDQEDKMLTLVLAALLGVAAARPQAVLPAGLSAAACPNYPFCGAETPADFPTPVVNGEPIAPILNTKAPTPVKPALSLAQKLVLENKEKAKAAVPIPVPPKPKIVEKQKNVK